MRLRELGWIPDLVLSSDAQRTRETLECMRESLDDPPAIFLEELYHAGLGALSAALAEVSPTTDRVLVLGHNPGWQDCVHQLTGVGCTMTTANAALMEIEATDWQHAVGQHGQWEWIELIQPKQL